MRGTIAGMVCGGLLCAIGLAGLSLVGEQPAGTMPPATPLTQAPEVDAAAQADPAMADGDAASDASADDPSTPVGSQSIDEPQAPDLPDTETPLVNPDAPSLDTPEASAPRTYTDPLDEPQVASIEGAMTAPTAPETVAFEADADDPVFPNPQSLAPQTPETEADLMVSTAPAQPAIVVADDVMVAADVVVAEDVVVVETTQEAPDQDAPGIVVADTEIEAAEPETDLADTDMADTDMADTSDLQEDMADLGDAATDSAPVEDEETFVVDLGADTGPATTPDATGFDGGADVTRDNVLTSTIPATSGFQLQGGENTLLGDRDSGVTVRRPSTDVASIDENDAPATPEPSGATGNALADYSADAGDVGSKPLMSIVLIDDGSMSAAAAALAGLPFPVTIALDPATDGAADMMAAYRADGFEVAIVASLPEGAQPSDVEVTFESVFSTLRETVAVLDIGDSGLQVDRDVTEQAMDILATQGRGFVTASQGLNMASRAANQAGVPAAVVFRDLDGDGQDARVVRRFVDQAAFRARQESGVVLVGRVRADTISALILWGSANEDDQVAVVPVSAVLRGVGG